jgi:hypothetical protein
MRRSGRHASAVLCNATATWTPSQRPDSTIDGVREIPQYQFVSDRAAGAMTKFGVTSISLLAHRTEIG